MPGGIMVTNEVATTKSETTGALRTYKHAADIENFYRFVHENSLRREAHLILSSIHGLLTKKKKGRRKKSAKKAKVLQ